MVEIVTLARHHDMSSTSDMCHDFRFPLHIQLHYESRENYWFVLLRYRVYLGVANKNMISVLFLARGNYLFKLVLHI